MVGRIPEQLDGANLTENADKITNIKINKDFLYHSLNSGIKDRLVETSSTKGAQPKLAIYTIQNLRIPVPSPPEQQKIADFLSTLDKDISLQQQKLDKLKNIKQSLLQKMMV